MQHQNEDKPISRRFFLLSLPLLCTQTQAATANRVMRVTAVEKLTIFTQIPSQIVGLAYERLGIKMELTLLPSARSLKAADHGDFDAELARFTQIEGEYPNLLRVPIPLGSVQYSPYVRAGSDFAEINSMKALRDSPLRIGVRLGAKFAEKELKGHVLNQVQTYNALFQMLLLNRVDVVLAPTSQLQEEIEQSAEDLRAGFKTIQRLKPIFDQPIYHYLHKRNAALLKPLAREIQIMEADGSIKKLWDTYLRQ
jgi:polar amino acid transport system substrate-binding protein